MDPIWILEISCDFILYVNGSPEILVSGNYSRNFIASTNGVIRDHCFLLQTFCVCRPLAGVTMTLKIATLKNGNGILIVLFTKITNLPNLSWKEQ